MKNIIFYVIRFIPRKDIFKLIIVRSFESYIYSVGGEIEPNLLILISWVTTYKLPLRQISTSISTIP